VYSFPMHYIRASFKKDTKIPGQKLEFIQEDNFLLSFKRGDNDRYIYETNYGLEYKKEFLNHLAIGAGFNINKQSPAGSLTYQMLDENGQNKLFNELNSTELSVNVRQNNEQSYHCSLLNSQHLHCLRRNRQNWHNWPYRSHFWSLRW